MKKRALLSVLPTLTIIATCLPQSGEAATTAYQALSGSHPNLTNRWSFDGANNAARLADQVGSAHLAEQTYGSGTAGDLAYGVGGWDGSSSAASTFRLNPGADNGGGAYFRAAGAGSQITLGNTFSFEAIVQADHATLSGGNFDLSYIIGARNGNDRAYFLTQGGPLPSTGIQFASTMGNGHNAGNTNTILGTLTAGNWYYIAGSYTANPGTNVTWVNHVADLTGGATTLTSTGFTNAGGTYPIGVPLDFGIGGRWDGQEAFDGQLDEIAFYNSALGVGEFQAHLDALLAPIPEPSQAILLLLGAVSILRRRR